MRRYARLRGMKPANPVAQASKVSALIPMESMRRGSSNGSVDADTKPGTQVAAELMPASRSQGKQRAA